MQKNYHRCWLSDTGVRLFFAHGERVKRKVVLGAGEEWSQEEGIPFNQVRARTHPRTQIFQALQRVSGRACVGGFKAGIQGRPYVLH